MILRIFLGALLGVTAHAQPCKKLLLASTSAVKTRAVKAGFAAAFPGSCLDVGGVAAQSGIPDQPIGEEAGILGATNRLAYLGEKGASYGVAIESYIEKRGEKEWIERAAITIKWLKSKRQVLILSEAVRVPSVYVEKALAAGSQTKLGSSVTVGTVIAAQLGVEHDDWHEKLAGISRSRIIGDAVFRALNSLKIEEWKAKLSQHKNFPKAGVLFQDIFPLVADSKEFGDLLTTLANKYRGKGINKVVGLDARGFIIGPLLAERLGASFVPIRKAGKIPGETVKACYSKEYGKDCAEIAKSSIQKGERAIIVDDLLATGGSALAAISLVKALGAEVYEVATLLTVRELAGWYQLSAPYFSLLN